MLIKTPCQITSHLLPGIRVGDGTISIGYAPTTGSARTRYVWHIDHRGSAGGPLIRSNA